MLGGFFCAPVFASEAPAIETFALKNGMEVVLVVNHRVPAVTHMLWYRVGAGDDFPSRSGLAHYNEHMMFQGTATTPSGEFARIVGKHGGHSNAFTTHDYTAYYVSIAKEYLPLIMQMEADRMLHLAPTEKNFLKEREVIIEERRMTIENKPGSLLSEEMQAELFRNHPYHTPIIGWMHEMQALTREDVLAFHKQFYHPANLVLVVAGDITRAELEPLAQKYYGGLPAGEKYARHWKSEPPQRGPRTLTLQHENVRQPEWDRVYTAAGVKQDDKAQVVPSFVLAQILGGGPTSRLYQSLVVRQKLAANAYADYDGIGEGPGEFGIHAVPAQGVSLSKLEAAIDAEIASIRGEGLSQGVSAEELTRAKLLIKAQTIYARDGLEDIARTLGGLIMAGLSPDYFTRWPSLIDEVTAEDIKKAALATLNPAQSVTGTLLPAQTLKSAVLQEGK
jgi:zinc protease